MDKKSFTIKHILNKNLKAQIKDPKNPDIRFYPVYIQIVHNRKNYRFKSIVKTYYTEEKDYIMEDRKLMLFEEELINKIVDYDIKLHGERFSFQGLSERITNYQASVYTIVDGVFRGKLKKETSKVKSPFSNVLAFDNPNLTVNVLMKAAVTLMPELNTSTEIRQLEQEIMIWQKYFDIFRRDRNPYYVYPSVIHWLAENHRPIIENKLSKDKEVNMETLVLTLAEFDKIFKLSTGNKKI